MTDRLRMGLFGIGYWGPLVIEIAQYLPEVIIDRIWSRDRTKTEALAAKLDDVGVESVRFADHENDFEGLDLVVVATPPAVIPALLQRSIELGIPTIVEKPVTLSLSTLKELSAAFRERRIPVAVNLQGRFVPGMHALRKQATSGRHGPIREVEVHSLGNVGHSKSPFSYSWKNEPSGGGVIGVSGPHAAEFILSLAGPGQVQWQRAWMEVPSRLDSNGVMRDCGASDNALIISEHDGGVMGLNRIGLTARKKEERWTIRCEGGTLRYTADGRAVLLGNDGTDEELPVSRNAVISDHQLGAHQGLLACSDHAFPSLVLLAAFAANVHSNSPAALPDLNTMERCLDLLGYA